MVAQSCYGGPWPVPEGETPWFCDVSICFPPFWPVFSSPVVFVCLRQLCAKQKQMGQVQCVICHSNRKGAFKETDQVTICCPVFSSLHPNLTFVVGWEQHEWAHVFCALWVKETGFGTQHTSLVVCAHSLDCACAIRLVQRTRCIADLSLVCQTFQ